jgi:hypothetical protein
MGPADIREHVKKRRDAELMDGAKTPISQALQGILPGVGIGALATALSHLILAKHLRPSVGHGALMGGSIGAYRGYTEGERKRKFFESLQDPKALEAVVQTFDRDRLT